MARLQIVFRGYRERKSVDRKPADITSDNSHFICQKIVWRVLCVCWDDVQTKGIAAANYLGIFDYDGITVPETENPLRIRGRVSRIDKDSIVCAKVGLHRVTNDPRTNLGAA